MEKRIIMNENLTYEDWKKIIMSNPSRLREVPSRFLTAELVQIAIRLNPANIRQRVKVALGVDSQTHSLHLCLFPFLPSFYLFSLRVESLEGLCVHVQSFQSC